MRLRARVKCGNGGVQGRATQEDTRPCTTPPPHAQPCWDIDFKGGFARARRFIPELLDDVLAGRINPGLVFDFTTDLDRVDCVAMDERRAIKSRLSDPAQPFAALPEWTNPEYPMHPPRTDDYLHRPIAFFGPRRPTGLGSSTGLPRHAPRWSRWGG